ncbi:MAG: tetratricopeptide repeat protein [Dysgonamonadaceae bacterium]|jgi:TolA-binding protein|nr:tetratricopeptide repeat protein [Dysgonamonadaceae bacterium]
MKKLFFLLCGLVFLHFTEAQNLIPPQSDLLFEEGKSMFEAGNYSGCVSRMLTVKRSVDVRPSVLEEADFLIIASGFHQNKAGIEVDLQDFLNIYRQSVHINEVYFMLGSTYFRKNDFIKAVEGFAEADLDKLSLVQQEDYAYRLGISYIETENFLEAERLLQILRLKSVTYKDAAAFYLASMYFSNEKYDNALELFQIVKDVDEFKDDAEYFLLQIDFAKGRYEKVAKDGKALIPKYPDVKRVVGLSCFQLNDYAKAIDFLKEYFEENNVNDTKDRYTFGLSYFYLGNFSRAVANFNKSNPLNDELGQNIFLLLGQSYLHLGDFSKALMAFQSASSMDFNPSVKEAAMYNYVMLLHQSSNSAFGQSVTALEDFINLYPNSIYADKVNDALIDVYLTTKSYETALNSISRIKNPGMKINQARQKIYFYLGTVNFTNSDYENAEIYFTKAISAGNYAQIEKNDALFWRGESFYKLGNYINAENDFIAFLNAGVKSKELTNLAVYNVAYCAFNRHKYADAERNFLRYTNIEKDPATVADAFARLGDCYFHNRQFANAENAYNRAISLAPAKSDYAVFQKGYVLGLQKDYAGKISQMNLLISDHPESPYLPDALYEKGRAYVLLNAVNDAIDTYRFLIKRFPESSNARKAALQIGLLYFNADMPEQAAGAYKEVIRLYPGSDEAKTAVQDLKSVYIDLNDVNAYADYVKSLGGAAKFDVSEQDSLTYLAAERFFLRNETDKAQNALINYLQQFADGTFNTNAHYYLGQIYYEAKNFEKAKDEFKKVLDAGNNRFMEESLVKLAGIYFDGENFEDALPIYERLQNTAENHANRNIGALGVVRAAGILNKHNLVISSANLLIKSENAEITALTEARFFRAKAYLALNENILAENDLIELAKDTRTPFGAESKYLLAKFYFDNRQMEKAREVIQDYIKQGTPHAYWLARSFILISDIYASEGEGLQARQYLESLKNNYKGYDDDIHGEIERRLDVLSKGNNE